jgi:RNA polymerase sigma-70 factor (ECF subfamily)
MVKEHGGFKQPGRCEKAAAGGGGRHADRKPREAASNRLGREDCGAAGRSRRKRPISKDQAGKAPTRPPRRQARQTQPEERVMSEFGPLLILEIPRLRHYAAKLTRDRVEADELVQSCLLRALVKQDLWQPGTDLRKWLFTMLYHQWVSELRRRARERNGLSNAERALAPAPNPDPIDRILAREMDRAITGLPEVHRQVMRRVALDDMTYPEAAVVLRLPQGTLRSRLARAREKLRRFAAEDGAGSPRRYAA